VYHNWSFSGCKMCCYWFPFAPSEVYTALSALGSAFWAFGHLVRTTQSRYQKANSLCMFGDWTFGQTRTMWTAESNQPLMMALERLVRVACCGQQEASAGLQSPGLEMARVDCNDTYFARCCEVTPKGHTFFPAIPFHTAMLE
jgi:hypothetical protein